MCYADDMGSQQNPDLTPAHPGAVVAEVIEAVGSSVDLMAQQLGISPAALDSVVQERSALTDDIAKRFEVATGTSADLLLRMQVTYDGWEMRKVDDARITPSSGSVYAGLGLENADEMLANSIVDDAGHKAALLEIQRLWEAEEGTADAKRLSALVDLVVAYERVHYPMGDGAAHAENKA